MLDGSQANLHQAAGMLYFYLTGSESGCWSKHLIMAKVPRILAALRRTCIDCMQRGNVFWSLYPPKMTKANAEHWLCLERNDLRMVVRLGRLLFIYASRSTSAICTFKNTYLTESKATMSDRPRVLEKKAKICTSVS